MPSVITAKDTDVSGPTLEDLHHLKSSNSSPDSLEDAPVFLTDTGFSPREPGRTAYRSRGGGMSAARTGSAEEADRLRWTLQGKLQIHQVGQN